MEQKLSPDKVNEKRLFRNVVFRGLYACELGGNPDIFLVDMITKDVNERTGEQIAISDEIKHEMISKISSIFKRKKELDMVIERFLVGWKMDRISLVDLSLLRMSVYDLMYTQSVPKNVVVSEAVMLSSSFCDDKSKKFVNGILSSVLDFLEADSDEFKIADDLPDTK